MDSPNTALGTSFLHRLPNELLLEVLQQCPDFSALWSLIHTCTKLRSLFSDNPTMVVESILKNSAVASPTRSLMLAILHIRNKSFTYCTWDEDRQHFILPDDDLCFPPTLPPVLLRKFISLVHRIHTLAHTCLDHYLQCFNAAALETPNHTKQATLPPSWFEEQRAILAFWRVQIFFELKTSLQGGHLMQHIPDFQSVTLKGFYNTYDQELALTALDYIKEALSSRAGAASEKEDSHYIKTPSSEMSLSTLNQGPLAPAVCGLLDNKANAFCLPEPDITAVRWTCSPKPTAPPPPINVPYFPFSVNYQPPEPGQQTLGWRFFLMLTDGIRHHGRPLYRINPGGPLNGKPFRPYRKLGFALWDDQRIADGGFCPWPWPMGYEAMRDYLDVWRVLLGADVGDGER